MKLRAAPGRHSFTVDTLSLLCTCLRGPTVPGSTVELGGGGVRSAVVEWRACHPRHAACRSVLTVSSQQLG